MAQQIKFIELALRALYLQDFRSASGSRLPEKQAGESGRRSCAAGAASAQVGLTPHPDRQSVHAPGRARFLWRLVGQSAARRWPGFCIRLGSSKQDWQGRGGAKPIGILYTAAVLETGLAKEVTQNPRLVGRKPDAKVTE